MRAQSLKQVILCSPCEYDHFFFTQPELGQGFSALWKTSIFSIIGSPEHPAWPCEPHSGDVVRGLSQIALFVGCAQS